MSKELIKELKLKLAFHGIVEFQIKLNVIYDISKDFSLPQKANKEIKLNI